MDVLVLKRNKVGNAENRLSYYQQTPVPYLTHLACTRATCKTKEGNCVSAHLLCLSVSEGGGRDVPLSCSCTCGGETTHERHYPQVCQISYWTLNVPPPLTQVITPIYNDSKSTTLFLGVSNGSIQLHPLLFPNYLLITSTFHILLVPAIIHLVCSI